MKKLQTKHFGEIEYDENLSICFDDGLPGFQDRHNFIVLLETPGDDTICWLQSVDDGDLAFAMINIYNIKPDYNPLVRPDEIESLGDLKGNNLLIYNILVIPNDVKHMRANLKAPIVINPVTRKGRQVLLNNDEYEVRYYVFDDLNKKANK